MTDSVPMVRKLQAEAVDPSMSVAALLRQAKVIATKLGQQDALRWIDAELSGYMRVKIDDLPPYRVLRGQPHAYYPYHGWQAIRFENPKHAHAFCKAYMGQSIGAIEQDLSRRSLQRDGQPMFPYAPEIKDMLRDAIDDDTAEDFGIFLSHGQIWEIVEAVRNLVLNWSLELEKAGVLGAEMTFSEDERRDAVPVTNQVIILRTAVA